MHKRAIPHTSKVWLELREASFRATTVVENKQLQQVTTGFFNFIQDHNLTEI